MNGASKFGFAVVIAAVLILCPTAACATFAPAASAPSHPCCPEPSAPQPVDCSNSACLYLDTHQAPDAVTTLAAAGPFLSLPVAVIPVDAPARIATVLHSPALSPPLHSRLASLSQFRF